MTVGFWAKGTPVAFHLHGEMTWTGRNGAWTGKGPVRSSPQDQPYLRSVPGPDARDVRHRAPCFPASMPINSLASLLSLHRTGASAVRPVVHITAVFPIR